MWYKSILETIGNTPLIQLNNVNQGLKPTILAKVEYFNPGHSVKDRPALKMIEDAEREGKLCPGSTIIEGTSGNTGMGLALAAVIKGYNCIFTTTDKQSPEKINLLRALGADVKVCPTNVEPDDPRSYYSVAKRLAEEIPNSYYPNQYDNPSNRNAHYETTGPEIWEQTEGKVTHFVAGMGTGGTVTGIGRYLKEKNPDIKIVGVDSVGSIYLSYFQTGEFKKDEIAPYLTEGIGEDIIPQNIDFKYIDDVIQCPDREAFLTTRALARREGMFVGGSCGAAAWGALEYARRNNLGEDDVMVVLLPDSGTRYVSKIFNDEWMQNNGFLDESSNLTAADIVGSKNCRECRLFSVSPSDTVGHTLELMNQHDISQLPVADNGRYVGSVNEYQVLNLLIADSSARNHPVSEVMSEPFPSVSPSVKMDQISKMINKNTQAVLVVNSSGDPDIVTRSDLIQALSSIAKSEVS